MKTPIDFSNWNRREHFEFFSRLDEPFHGLITEVDCTWAYQHCKQHQISFFLFYLYQTLRAIHQVPEMRYRIENGQVYDYAQIDANATISRSDHTFGFCPIQYHTDFAQFCEHASTSMRIVKESSGLCLNEESQREDVIHFSAVPWIRFSGITHARQYDRKDSIPKISVGKCIEQAGKWTMPVACFVHHALVDGYHVHQFFQQLETGLSEAGAATSLSIAS